MQLKCLFDMVTMDDEIIAVPVGNGAEEIHGVLKVNKEGQEILELLKNQTNENQIVDDLMEKYSNNRHELVSYVHNFIDMLREYGLIKE